MSTSTLFEITNILDSYKILWHRQPNGLHFDEFPALTIRSKLFHPSLSVGRLSNLNSPFHTVKHLHISVFWHYVQMFESFLLTVLWLHLFLPVLLQNVATLRLSSVILYSFILFLVTYENVIMFRFRAIKSISTCRVETNVSEENSATIFRDEDRNVGIYLRAHTVFLSKWSLQYLHRCRTPSVLRELMFYVKRITSSQHNPRT
jgi:hypothetical protein